MSISTDVPHSFQIIHGRVVTPTKVIENGTVQVQDQTITYVGSTANAPIWKEQTTYDAKSGLVIPGFIDIHVHGGMGADFMDSDPHVLDTITSFHASQGTTALLATTMTAPHADIDHVLEQVYAYMQNGKMPGAQIEGVHLEGPFISPKWPGAQNPEHIVLPNIEWLEQWESRYPGLIKQLTLAPEREGALELISWLRQHDITAAAGHTDASYEEIMLAVEQGLNHAVHTFNAMTPLHHRKPGVAGAVLSTPAIHAEIIADGIHVHPAAVSILAQLKQQDNLILITDAMSAAGLGDGEYMLGDQPVKVLNGIATLPDDSGTLAGSRLTMIEGFRFLIQQVGLSILQASAAGSGNPARELGLYEQTGSLEIGKRADILVLNPDMELQHIFIKGLLKSYNE
ncbi:N-acetylglucosamine-6-phosphate deacetylase [Paenibacillus sp. PK4536]|uniref:N-acetylglucosamine-6-phosphate deacetylase n=1 Tax=Paenibacillus sp. PK4536 TaxID=3024576 RepID=UPI0023581789|nr:N-acetylglucosamine-6-phosphate deacetylase [Paenibacillus sp. PK4536]WIM39408.1 N-acetylglucosamine-6-phosphate deacetylase [Paenibacillus sp. PK4536]